MRLHISKSEQPLWIWNTVHLAWEGGGGGRGGGGGGRDQAEIHSLGFLHVVGRSMGGGKGGGEGEGGRRGGAFQIRREVYGTPSNTHRCAVGCKPGKRQESACSSTRRSQLSVFSAIPSFPKMSVELGKPLPEMTSMVEAFTLPSASRNLNSTLAGAASRLATTKVDLKLAAFVVEGISSFTCGTPLPTIRLGSCVRLSICDVQPTMF